MQAIVCTALGATLVIVGLARGIQEPERESLQLEATLEIGSFRFCRADERSLLAWFEALVTVTNEDERLIGILEGREVLGGSAFAGTREDLLGGERTVSFGGHSYVTSTDPLDPAGAELRVIEPGESYEIRLEPVALVRPTSSTSAEAVAPGRNFLRLYVDLALLWSGTSVPSHNVQRARWETVETDAIEVVVAPPGNVSPCD